MAPDSAPVSYRFGPFTVDSASYRVLRDGAVVALTPKVLDLLLHLLDHAGELVTKEALLDAIWPDANVTDNALTQAISELRQALDDDASAPRYVKTVARRGYRFIGAVTSTAEGGAALGTIPRDDNGVTRQSKTIAVFDFTNVTGDQDTSWLSAGVAETVTADLRSLGDFRVIDCRRVRDAVTRLGNSLEAVAREVHAGLVVVGSFQRQGPRIRITARLVNVVSGEALADAKVDGPVDTIFDLQDRIVVQLASELGLKIQQTDGSRIGARETESLDAFRAFTEGWLHLESLSVDELQQAVIDFEHAVTLDHRYALAHTGLASAKFALYETTRSENEPEVGLLRAALEHARHAVALDDGLAEAHAALALILVSDWETVEALAEARRAVALEPTNWRHYFRLGHASWGTARLRAAETTLSQYPGFAFAHFQMAMLHVARGHLDKAESILGEGSVVQDRQRGRRERYPALGLHWLAALIRLAANDVAGALKRFDDELALADVGRLYGREYTMLARHGRGVALIRSGRLDEAAQELGLALALYPDHAQSHLAMALAHRDRPSLADQALARADAIAAVLDRSRPVEGAVVRAARHAVAGRLSEASQTLAAMLKTSPPGFAGWAIPVEPLFRDLVQDPSFTAVSEILAARAA